VIMMLWIGWVMVLTLCVLALRARLPDPVVSKAAFTLGAMATTLPWFGLYTAQMIDG